MYAIDGFKVDRQHCLNLESFDRMHILRQWYTTSLEDSVAEHRARRIRNNVAVQFRAMLFFKELYGSPEFWYQVSTGTLQGPRGFAPMVQRTYVEARKAYLQSPADGITVPNQTAKLVDEWIEFSRTDGSLPCKIPADRVQTEGDKLRREWEAAHKKRELYDLGEALPSPPAQESAVQQAPAPTVLKLEAPGPDEHSKSNAPTPLDMAEIITIKSEDSDSESGPDFSSGPSEKQGNKELKAPTTTGGTSPSLSSKKAEDNDDDSSDDTESSEDSDSDSSEDESDASEHDPMIPMTQLPQAPISTPTPASSTVQGSKKRQPSADANTASSKRQAIEARQEASKSKHQPAPLFPSANPPKVPLTNSILAGRIDTLVKKGKDVDLRLDSHHKRIHYQEAQMIEQKASVASLNEIVKSADARIFELETRVLTPSSKSVSSAAPSASVSHYHDPSCIAEKRLLAQYDDQFRDTKDRLKKFEKTIEGKHQYVRTEVKRQLDPVKEQQTLHGRTMEEHAAEIKSLGKKARSMGKELEKLQNDINTPLNAGSSKNKQDAAGTTQTTSSAKALISEISGIDKRLQALEKSAPTAIIGLGNKVKALEKAPASASREELKQLKQDLDHMAQQVKGLKAQQATLSQPKPDQKDLETIVETQEATIKDQAKMIEEMRKDIALLKEQQQQQQQAAAQQQVQMPQFIPVPISPFQFPWGGSGGGYQPGPGGGQGNGGQY